MCLLVGDSGPDSHLCSSVTLLGGDVGSLDSCVGELTVSRDFWVFFVKESVVQS